MVHYRRQYANQTSRRMSTQRQHPWPQASGLMELRSPRSGSELGAEGGRRMLATRCRRDYAFGGGTSGESERDDGTTATRAIRPAGAESFASSNLGRHDGEDGRALRHRLTRGLRRARRMTRRLSRRWRVARVRRHVHVRHCGVNHSSLAQSPWPEDTQLLRLAH